MRNWKPITEHSITLDGEWEFFPSTLLMKKHAETEHIEKEGRMALTPGDWVIPNNTSDQYGFGSYRLRILVNPEIGNSYGIYIPDIDSSSEVYVNGKLITQSGQPADDKQQYTPLTIPQTTYFTIEDTNEIELVIQIANFDNPISGGINRSIKFGLAEPFTKDTTFATSIVLGACIVYMLHALYSFILFLVGNRDWRLFHFSLMVVCIVLGTLIGERLLFAWLPLNYEWGVKILNLTMVAGGYFLLQSIKHQLTDDFRNKIHIGYMVLCSLSVLVILVFPASINLSLKLFYGAVMLIPCLLTPLVMYRASTRIDKDNIFLLLAAVASIGSLIWLLINEALQIEMVSYPFDLLIAMVCFATYWFKQYFRVLDESQDLAIELQEADKQKDNFLATVAHEMRNPLHGMINISQSVLDREERMIKEKSVKDLELLITVGQRMSYQLNDLLDLTRLKEKRVSIQPTDVSLHSAAEAVMDMLRYMTEDRPIRLINRIPNNFPYVCADENRLIQILFNLIHNAVKYTNEGEISVQASIQDGFARISVRDTGIGMDEEFLGTIFEPYEQSSYGIASTDSGFGLGLSICKQLVKLHGGTLEVTSKPDNGSVFTFSLKLSVNSTQLEAAASKSKENETEEIAAAEMLVRKSVEKKEPSSSNPVRLLAVDDDPVNLKVLESIFSDSSYEVFSATSGQGALSVLNTREWDVIIADVMMPHMSGYELTRKIREHFSLSELPVLLLTARSHPEDIVAGFIAGANDYVTKPIEGLELKTRINTLVNLKQSISERLRMEAAWLQAQIQPHFLYNTLNTIASLSEIDINRMTDLLAEFGNYLRKSFDPKNLLRAIPLNHELELLNSYLFIEKERFGDRLNIVWQVDEAISIEIPPLSIQPLVENAIRHGVLKRIEGGTVVIRIIDKGNEVEIAVIDDGIGMDAEISSQILTVQPMNKKSIGLYNTNRRLQQMYGNGLKIFSNPSQGTTVIFSIPKIQRSLD
ncbi:hybrid sensor histidine kinase/response regulator [Siminovitchia acidinfaciens]|uniref:hybrid sensor histidine kinase/response regulator n=1 Tax=Siminovitchia acidinfaciens TaxID=2321395 RepID=UPI001F31EB6E|nr:ATP-binding protein [Siminovitchia acidinfaciens]